MTGPGRNAACPCGSGRKYRRCCGRGAASATPGLFDDADATDPRIARFPSEERRADAVKAHDERLVSALMKFAARELGPDWLDHALDLYLADSDDLLDEREMALAVPWALFTAPAAGLDVSVGEMAADAPRRARIDDDMLEVLIDQLDAWLGIWEVRHVEPGRGMAVKDLLTKEERFVHEQSASRMLIPGDTVLARIVDSAGVSFIGGAFPQRLSPLDAEYLAKQVRRLCRVRTRPVNHELLRSSMLQRAMIDGWRRTVEARSAVPGLTDIDGEAFVLTRDRFDIVGDRDAIITRLASFPGAREHPDGGDEVGELAFVITRPGGPLGDSVLGHVLVGSKLLRVETMSVQRADDLRAALVAHLGSMVRFRMRDEAGLDELLERAQRTGAGRSAAPAPSDAEVRALERQLREQYMTDWMDQPVPALGGLTPRAAATDSPTSRRSLELLLKDFEHHEARLPAEDRLDVGRLRRELLGDAGDTHRPPARRAAQKKPPRSSADGP
jgi:hypothetical protein